MAVQLPPSAPPHETEPRKEWRDWFESMWRYVTGIGVDGGLEFDFTAHINSTANPHSVTFSQAVAADSNTDITASEAETLTDGSNADSLHVHNLAVLAGTIDISDQTNLAVTSPIVLTDDTLSFDFSTDNTWTGTNTFNGDITIGAGLSISGANPCIVLTDTDSGDDDWRMCIDSDEITFDQFVSDSTWTTRLNWDNTNTQWNFGPGIFVNQDGIGFSRFGPDSTILTPNSSADQLASVKTVQDTSGVRRAIIGISEFDGSSNTSGQFAGLNAFGHYIGDGADATATASFGSFSGGRFGVRLDQQDSGANPTITLATGISAFMLAQTSSEPVTMTEWRGVQAEGGIPRGASASVTVTTASQFYAEDWAPSTNGVVTNLYGLFIEDLTSADSINEAIALAGDGQIGFNVTKGTAATEHIAGNSSGDITITTSTDVNINPAAALNAVVGTTALIQAPSSITVQSTGSVVTMTGTGVNAVATTGNINFASIGGDVVFTSSSGTQTFATQDLIVNATLGSTINATGDAIALTITGHTTQTDEIVRIDDDAAASGGRQLLAIRNSSDADILSIEYSSITAGVPEIIWSDDENTKIGFPFLDYFAFINDSTEIWLGIASDPTLYFNFDAGSAEQHGQTSNLQNINYFTSGFDFHGDSANRFMRITPNASATGPVTFALGSGTDAYDFDSGFARNFDRDLLRYSFLAY